MKKIVHVAVGVIQRSDGAILIAKRPDHAHQGGLWEFPGGKVEQGEPVTAALARELHEELDIQVVQSEPLIQIAHDYSDKSVLLDVWRVTEFSGVPVGKEGQPLRWCLPSDLLPEEFPAANVPIIHALKLPARYWITPEPDRGNLALFWLRVDQALESGVSLVQLRAKQFAVEQLRPLLQLLVQKARAKKAQVLVNGWVELAAECDGVHLTAAQLQQFSVRPIAADKWLAASCHNEAELKLAGQLGCDFLVLSPVQATSSHPEQAPLGWPQFADWVKQVPLPVYALGGMRPSDVALAKAKGAQGIAGISQLF